MIIFSILLLLAGGYCFYLVTLAPVAIYNKLDIEVARDTGASSCRLCKRKWAALSVTDKTYSHTETNTVKVLVDEITRWRKCKDCQGAGIVGRRVNYQRGDGREDTGIVESQCATCGGSGGYDEVVEQIFEDKKVDTDVYLFDVHCGNCRSGYQVEGEKPPYFPSRTKVSFKNRLNQGLVKGMVTGVIIGVVIALYWSLTGLPDRLFGDDPATNSGYIAGIGIFFFAGALLSIPGIIIGLLWGAIVSAITPILAIALNEESYLFALLIGGLSLVLFIFSIDLIFSDFLHIGGRDAGWDEKLLAYGIMFLFGACSFAAGKLFYSLIERRRL